MRLKCVFTGLSLRYLDILYPASANLPKSVSLQTVASCDLLRDKRELLPFFLVVPHPQPDNLEMSPASVYHIKPTILRANCTWNSVNVTQ